MGFSQNLGWEMEIALHLQDPFLTLTLVHYTIALKSFFCTRIVAFSGYKLFKCVLQ